MTETGVLSGTRTRLTSSRDRETSDLASFCSGPDAYLMRTVGLAAPTRGRLSMVPEQEQR